MNTMPRAENIRHRGREFRQSELPIVKFRSSCDLCTKAKVRCDKQHPQCNRCTNKGITCRYSVSLRTGKPAFDFMRALNDGMLPVQPHRPAHDPTRCADAVADLLLRFDANEALHNGLQAVQRQSPGSITKRSTPPASDSDSLSASVMLFEQQDMSVDLDPGRSNPFSTFSPMPNIQNNNISVQTGRSTTSSSHSRSNVTNINDNNMTNADKISLSGVESHSPGFSFSAQPLMDLEFLKEFDLSESEPLQASEIPSPDSIIPGANGGTDPINLALQEPQTSLHGDCCLGKARALQRSIMIMTARDKAIQGEHGVLGSTPPLTTTDQALLMCSSIGQRMIELLQCRCEADAHLPFLITALISKILATYGAIANVDDSTLFDFGTRKKSQTEQEEEEQQQQEKDAFAAVPLRLGAYDVDRELEGVLRAHLVLHELSKLECITQLFEDRYCQSIGNEKLGEDRAIYLALSQFIKNRYATTKAACELKKTLPKEGT
ncbi:hypothetical protein F5Y19DRAFT_230761 [Xylariaceae sp. FL1651]|nr:hypothetical protein F5Y19DRAFT_230761 [Xylariaceae sp. FL1651]